MSHPIDHEPFGRLFDRLAARPLFMCGFRPFFLATVVYAVLLLLMWQGFLAAGLGVPAVPGGPVVWHAHELMFGFGLAAVAGFLAGLLVYRAFAPHEAPAPERPAPAGV